MRPAHLTRSFARHYVQMVGVMFAGMLVLGLPAGWILDAAGSSWSELSTGPMLALMAATMTVPMVPYMRWMGHGWRPTLEMVAAMVVPAAGALVLLGAGLVADASSLMVLEHIGMFAAMYAVMAMRPEEYSHPHGRHGAAVRPQTEGGTP